VHRVAIDHCLVSPEIAIRDRHIGPDVGSDHFPVVLDFALAGEAPVIKSRATNARSAAP